VVVYLKVRVGDTVRGAKRAYFALFYLYRPIYGSTYIVPEGDH